MKRLVFLVSVCMLLLSKSPFGKAGLAVQLGAFGKSPLEKAGSASQPGAFGKTSPANAATGVTNDLLLTWEESSDVLVYEYCYDTSDDNTCTGWLSAGPNTSAGLSSLPDSTTYYWQVRAVGPGGTTYADSEAGSDAWWHFTTLAPLPQAFHKLAPADYAADVAITPTLRWEASPYAIGYEYCLRSDTDPSCDLLWTEVGNTTSVVLPPLASQTGYSWTVRAVGLYGMTYAGSGPTEYWHFTTANRPGAFSKLSPVNGSQEAANTLTLAWQASQHAGRYEYCLVESILDPAAGWTGSSCTEAWIDAGASTTAWIQDLKSNTRYTWQVRAVGPGGITEANEPLAWHFTTQPSGDPPLPFSKQAPGNQAEQVALTPILRWEASSNATRFDYCVDTTPDSACSTRWVSAGNSTSRLLSNLNSNTTYYWQVRAYGPGGLTYANNNAAAHWQFTTLAVLPGDFYKLTPQDGAINTGTAPVLAWGSSPHASAYEYCLDTTNDSACATEWINVGLTTTVQLSGLQIDTVYYWHVRAISPAGQTYADRAETGHWRFTTFPRPGAFHKSAPSHTADGVALQSTGLDWSASNNFTHYEYCLDTSNDNLCNTTWSNNLTSTHASLPDLLQNTTYYWQVRASGPGGVQDADNGVWWQFTTLALPPAAFQKISPLQAAGGIGTNPTSLIWTASSYVTGYEYCLDTSNNDTCNTTWRKALQETNAAVDGLERNTTYYWQVRAKGPGGVCYANDGAWWHFTSLPAAPRAFSLRLPADSAVNVPTNPSLTWAASAGASSYEYCLQASDQNTCSTSWINVGNYTSTLVGGLAGKTSYTWLVRAIGPGGVTEANAGAWRRFTTGAVTHSLYLPLMRMSDGK